MIYVHHALFYEIADDWLREADAQHFRAWRECYRTSSAPCGGAFPVEIDAVLPLIRVVAGRTQH